MPIITRDMLPSRQEDYQANQWVKDECYKFYVHQRRRNCTFRQLLDLWLRAPCCDDCIQSEIFFSGEPPDIMQDAWEVDVLLNLGIDTLEIIQGALDEDPDFSLLCKQCHEPLRPWDRDNIYILTYHLEEHYGIPMETPGRRQPSERLRQLIIDLYDNTCFGCDAADRELHIDHILPQSKGGDAAFRNLQPLCEICGNEKGDSIPDEVKVFSDIYFGPYPSDGYEGLFW